MGSARRLPMPEIHLHAPHGGLSLIGVEKSVIGRIQTARELRREMLQDGDEVAAGLRSRNRETDLEVAGKNDVFFDGGSSPWAGHGSEHKCPQLIRLRISRQQPTRSPQRDPSSSRTNAAFEVVEREKDGRVVSVDHLVVKDDHCSVQHHVLLIEPVL